jgi:hypothetical protein
MDREDMMPSPPSIRRSGLSADRKTVRFAVSPLPLAGMVAAMVTFRHVR